MREGRFIRTRAIGAGQPNQGLLCVRLTLQRLKRPHEGGHRWLRKSRNRKRRRELWPEGKMSERSINTKTPVDERQFDPVAFFETAAEGRIISKHRKKEIVFSQGDDADSVFYIKKGKVKVTVV